jgi:hypothetical protein
MPPHQEHATMNALDTIRTHLLAIAATAETAAEALDGADVDWTSAAVERFVGQMGAVADRLEGVCDLLSTGVFAGAQEKGPAGD